MLIIYCKKLQKNGGEKTKLDSDNGQYMHARQFMHQSLS